jgi:large subunit ribosomal protein L5
MAEKEKSAKKDAPAAAPKEKKAKPAGAGSRKEKAANAVEMASEGSVRISPTTGCVPQENYIKTIRPELQKTLGFKNVMDVPRIEKIVINCAVKEAIGNPKVLDVALNEVMAITGQKPVITRAKKAIAAFKVRKGNGVAVMVTLRNARMYEFFDRLVNISLPRVRDFKGVSAKAFDGRGNYSLGIKEQIIFPEINYDAVDKLRGMTITIVTSAKKNEHARALLAEMGMPFRK